VDSFRLYSPKFRSVFVYLYFVSYNSSIIKSRYLRSFLFIFTLLVIIQVSLNQGTLGPFLFIFTLLVIIQASLNPGT